MGYFKRYCPIVDLCSENKNKKLLVCESRKKELKNYPVFLRDDFLKESSKYSHPILRQLTWLQKKWDLRFVYFLPFSIFDVKIAWLAFPKLKPVWRFLGSILRCEGLIFLERIRSKLAFISQMWVISWSWELLQIQKLNEELPRCIWLDVYFLCYLMVFVIICVLWIPMSPNSPSQLSFDFARRRGIWFKILHHGLLRLQCALFAVSTMIKHKIS